MLNIPIWLVVGLFYTGTYHWSGCLGQNSSVTADLADASRLRTDIIDAHDHRFRPILNQSSSIIINIEFRLFQLLHVDEIEMKMRISCSFRFQWMDEIRVWSRDSYNWISVIYPDPTDVWRPRIFIFNSLEDQDVFKDDYAHLSVFWTGRTIWHPAIILTTSCKLNLQFFPFDQQVCHVIARSSSFLQDVEFETPYSKAFIDEYTPNSEWKLVKTEILQYQFRSGIESYSVLKISLFLKRDPGSFFVNSLLPTMMLSFLSLMVFVLPRSSGERAGYCMTVLMALSFIQSSVSSTLPQAAQSFPFIGIYLFILLFLSWMMVICTMGILVWHNRQENKRQANTHESNEQNSAIALEESFVPAHNSFDGELDDESLKAFYGPLSHDDNSSYLTSGGNSGNNRRRRFVFLRDFRKVHPVKFENNTSKADFSPRNNNSYLDFIILKMAKMSKLFTADIDVILFWIFLSLWLSVSLVFLLIMALGS